MNIFKLPDLGEGLIEVEIVEWLVKEGDEVELDQPMAAVETAKAIVEIPSPKKGIIFKLYGAVEDIVNVGDPLVEFTEIESEKSGNPAKGKPEIFSKQTTKEKMKGEAKREDTGTVAGEIIVGNKVVNDEATAVGHASIGVKATPAVRALGRRMDVDLSVVTPSGPKDTITAADVQRVAKIFKEVGQLETLRGVRRAMAKTMSQANAEVVPVTIYDDVDINIWKGSDDITTRLIRAIAVACEKEPSLNAWYDSHAMGRRLLKQVDLAIAVDTSEGLFVPVLRNVGQRDKVDLRKGLTSIKKAVHNRDIPPAEMRGYSFTLSNFGTFAGRYANPIVVPPTVGILAAGKIRQEVVVFQGEPAVRWMLPLSLTFDHRAATGGEATRFVAALLEDLSLPE